MIEDLRENKYTEEKWEVINTLVIIFIHLTNIIVFNTPCTGDTAMKKTDTLSIIQVERGNNGEERNHNWDEFHKEEKLNPKEGAHPKEVTF